MEFALISSRGGSASAGGSGSQQQAGGSFPALPEAEVGPAASLAEPPLAEPGLGKRAMSQIFPRSANGLISSQIVSLEVLLKRLNKLDPFKIKSLL